MKFELFKRYTLRGRRWYWRLVASNGKTVAQSEGYHNRTDAINTINAIRNNASAASVVESL